MQFVETKDDGIIKSFVDKLVNYNIEMTKDSEFVIKKHTFLAKSDDGKNVGLIEVELFFQYAFVKTLIIDIDYRKKGAGSFLLTKAEEFAKTNNCHSLWLDTFSFQAPKFYEKHGYKSFGQLSNYPDNHKRLFYCKKLSGL